LGITGDLAAEWDQFRIALIDSGASIQDKDDELMWTGGDTSGSLTVKNAYLALLSTQGLTSLGGWRQTVWKWDIQLKIKLFIWLAAENKILTWDNLQQKGWEGPSRCQLCKQETENINHLFIHCSFTKSVWERIKTGQKLKKVWEGNTLSDCFKNWTEDKSVPSIIAAHICWYIWLERNSTIFEKTSPSIHSVVSKTLGSQKRHLTSQKLIPLRACMISQHLNTTIACFDGATQADGKQCGAGGVFKTLDLTVYRWVFNCGGGTNTRAELLGVWATLMLATHLSFQRLQVLGDSKVVIDWLSKRGRLQASAIEGWKSRIKELIKPFQEISFEHIYREYNKEADLLSKQALWEPEGRITYYKWDNGTEGPRRHLSLY
jgi:ribonuclease HI